MRKPFSFFLSRQHSQSPHPSFFQNPIQTEEPPVELQESHLEVADDYTKRKNVFRVKTTNGSEYLCQADHEEDMKEWMHAIEETAIAIVVDDRKDPAFAVSASSSTNRGLRKLTSFRNRSPSVHAPATKSRKASEGKGLLGSSLNRELIHSCFNLQSRQVCCQTKPKTRRRGRAKWPSNGRRSSTATNPASSKTSLKEEAP